MVIVEYNDIELDYCTSCQGVWFDSGELELFLEAASLENYQDLLSSIVSKPEASSTEKKRKCPICFKKMKKIFMDEGGEILVDICRHGHGIWFDGQEVKRLLTLLAEKGQGKPDSRQEVMGFLGEIFKY